MLKKIIRKIFWKKKYLQLRGAKILKDKKDPFFVCNTVSSLSEVSLDINPKKFPKILVGSHGKEIDILLRQALLKRYSQLCSSIMYSIGSSKPLVTALPPTWINHIQSKGIKSSIYFCNLNLFLLAIINVFIGCRLFFQFLILAKFGRNPDSSYVAFMDLQHKNLPDKGENKQHDIISWYNNSKIKNPKIKEIWVQAKVNKKYNPESGLIVSQNIFPKIKKISSFVTRVIISFFVTIYGISIGRWWYGYLYRESISLHYTSLISNDSLAEDYYFHNSGWFFKPLWTYEIEKKGSNVILYFYSTNMKVFKFNEYNQDETYGLKIMSWKRFLVWDQFQEDYLKQFCPTASFVKIGYLNFSGMIYVKASNTNKKIISVFDVTPTRKLKYMSLGYAIPPYYSEENNLRFLEDISQIINTKNWLLLWKPKRWVDSKFISNSFKKKQFLLTENIFSKVNPDISANSLVKNSDIVISMPFSSPSICAKIIGIPSIFYDASGNIKKNMDISHNVPTIRGKKELEGWFESLN